MIKLTTTILILILFISCTNRLCQNKKLQNVPVSLSASFNKNFFIGAAINEDQILESDKHAVSIIKKEFNSITPENAMKWVFIQPKPEQFTFDMADKYVAFGLENKMHIVGHTLVWHSQLPDFMKNVKDPSVMSNYMKNHINTVVSRYKGKIKTWDVVNEALNKDGSLRASPFLNVLGKKYIETAFKLAEKADPDAHLVYNDFNLTELPKRKGVIRLVKQLKKSGTKINAVGIQAHWQLNTPSLEDIEKTIIEISELGVQVMFTELDISVLPNPWELEGAEISQNFKDFEGDEKMNPYPKKLPESVQEQLAKRYQDIFKLFLKHEDKINRVTFWGVTDKQSWLNDWPIKGRTNYPLFFDKAYQPKKVYQTVLDLKNTSN